MKSRKIVLAVLFVFMYVGLNAQVFVGGNLGFSTAGGNHDNGVATTDKPSSLNFNLSPAVGKFLNENLAVGVALNINVGRTEIPGSPETINTSSGFGLTPFLRYYALRMDKFSVFVQGNVGYSYTGSKSKTGGVSTDGPQTSSLFLNVIPDLSYDLGDRLSLETSINILNFGFNYTSVKSGTDKDRTTTFGFGAGLNHIVTVGDISIGAIYKF